MPKLLVEWTAFNHHYLIDGLREPRNDNEGFFLSLETIVSRRILPQPLIDDEDRHAQLLGNREESFDVFEFALQEGE